MVEIVELADRRTRFALLILGALNGVNLLVAVRADALGIEGLSLMFIRAYITCYVLLSLYFFTYAIVALKPRLHQPPPDRVQRAARVASPRRRRAPAERGRVPPALERGAGGGAEPRDGVPCPSAGPDNAAKYHALERVYRGLVILVVLTAILIADGGRARRQSWPWRSGCGGNPRMSGRPAPRRTGEGGPSRRDDGWSRRLRAGALPRRPRSAPASTAPRATRPCAARA